MLYLFFLIPHPNFSPMDVRSASLPNASEDHSPIQTPTEVALLNRKEKALVPVEDGRKVLFDHSYTVTHIGS